MKSAVLSPIVPPERTPDDPVATLAKHQAALSEAEAELEDLTQEIRRAGVNVPADLTRDRLAAHLRMEDLRSTLLGVEQAAQRWRHQQIRDSVQAQWEPLAAARHTLYRDLEAAVEQIIEAYAKLQDLQARQLAVVDQAAEIARPGWVAQQEDRLGATSRAISQQILEGLKPLFIDVLGGRLLLSVPRLPRLGVEADPGCEPQLRI